MARAKKRHEQHVRLYRHELHSAAYRSLSPDARALLVEFRSLYNGTVNCVFLSRREMQRRLGVGRIRAEQARDQLLDRGFIRLVTKGSFSQKVKRASEYVLTNEPLEPDRAGAVAPKDYMRWRQKNTGSVSNPVGVGDQPREQRPKPQKYPVGVGDQPREARSDPSVGVGDQPTVMLPPHRGDNWLHGYGGWPCKNGLLLNTCCIVCGVWTTSDGREFDDRRHSCDEVSKARHKRRLAEAA